MPDAPIAATAALFQPLALGPLTLPHRIVLAPLTRSRAGQPGNVPTPLNAAYYAQRASAALVISEATQVSQQGQGYAWTPGIHSPQQVSGWQAVTRAVHDAGGRMFLQLWHVGRISHPALQPDGMLPVAPSALLPPGEAFIANEQGQGMLVPFVVPRALDSAELPYLVQQYARGARNARAAGFDGVEVHAANGYLLDQFLESGTNQRTDSYGGSVANRARLVLDVLDAVIEVWGAERVGLRLSPYGTFNGMHDDQPRATFGYVAAAAAERGLAYLHVVRPLDTLSDGRQVPHAEADAILALLRERFRGVLMVAGGYEPAEAATWVAEGRADAIVFGRKFLANPDLPARIARGAALNIPDPASFYGGTERGYTDYPAMTASS